MGSSSGSVRKYPPSLSFATASKMLDQTRPKAIMQETDRSLDANLWLFSRICARGFLFSTNPNGQDSKAGVTGWVQCDVCPLPCTKTMRFGFFCLGRTALVCKWTEGLCVNFCAFGKALPHLIWWGWDRGTTYGTGHGIALFEERFTLRAELS